MSFKQYRKLDKHQRINASAPAKSRLPWAVVGLVVLITLTAGYVFPNAWNSTVGKIDALSMRETPFKLGLDLVGGTHLVYEADLSQISSDEKSNSLSGVRDVIERRVNAFGVAEPMVQTTKSGDSYRIIVELAGVSDVSDAIKQIGETPILEFKRPGTSADLELTDEQKTSIKEANASELETAEGMLTRALNGDDFEDISNETEGAQFITGEFVSDDSNLYAHAGKLKVGSVSKDIFERDIAYSVVELADTRDAKEYKYDDIIICHNEAFSCTGSERTFEEAKSIAEGIVSQSNDRTFKEMKAEVSEPNTRDTSSWVAENRIQKEVADFLANDNNGDIGIAKTDLGLVVVKKLDDRTAKQYKFKELAVLKTTPAQFVQGGAWTNTDLSGAQLKRAGVEFDQNTGTPYVTLVFDSDGAEMFGDLTSSLVGQRIAIFLDGSVISSPVVQTAIYGGEAIITGAGDLEEAKILAQRLNAGALPVPIELVSQQTVGPLLGAVSLDKSLSAGLIGIVLIALFMLIYYRLPGLLSVLALSAYAVLVLTIFKFLPVTLTLSGLAGFILSVGMAVDANVLIFERLKEELNMGRNIDRAIDQGFKRAWTSIRDGNVTTLIACAILYWFSSSFIQGFALTLAVGILVSMFSAITITRILLMLTSRVKILNKPFLFGVKEIR